MFVSVLCIYAIVRTSVTNLKGCPGPSDAAAAAADDDDDDDKGVAVQ